MSYQTYSLNIQNHIADLRFNRPDKANSLNQLAWDEMKRIFEELDVNDDVRVVVLSGEGKHFCAGIDLSLFISVAQSDQGMDEGRRREKLRRHILHGLQAPINAIVDCRKPVLTAVDNGCIGAGIDIITACDMNYCTEQAYFQVKEIDMGIVADLGTLQRLPAFVGEPMARELAFTGRKVSGPEAQKLGLVNRVFADRESMLQGVMALAETIAAKSPLAMRGTKEVMNYSRDRSISDGLNYVATWNAAMILSDDVQQAFQAQLTKSKPSFQN
ncbi:MAG: crotonase/enoyl-CoA hydratase family protein [Bacteroidota bacterium]